MPAPTYPYSLAVAQTSVAIALTNPSPICHGTPRWATANTRPGRGMKRVRVNW
jgi:hypothetical protein